MPRHTFLLESERLILRSLVSDDAAALSAVGNDRRITSVTRSIPYPFNIPDAEAWIEMKQSDPNGYSFGIFRKTDDLLLGQIGLLQIELENELGELGFFVGCDHWGNGYVTEAANEMLVFGFNTVKLNRIAAHHLVHNVASGAVLKKIGMDQEGTFRQRVKKDGTFGDVLAYAILRESFGG